MEIAVAWTDSHLQTFAYKIFNNVSKSSRVFGVTRGFGVKVLSVSYFNLIHCSVMSPLHHLLFESIWTQKYVCKQPKMLQSEPTALTRAMCRVDVGPILPRG